MEKGDFDRAIADLQKALQLNGKYALAHINRGLLYYRRGETDFAIRDYNEAIRLDPKSALAYMNRGHAYAKIGRSDLAFADFNKGLEIMPENPAAFTGLATLYELEARFAEAETLYKRALASFEKRFGPMHPYVAEVLEHYGSMLRKIGRESEAAEIEARIKAIRARRAPK